MIVDEADPILPVIPTLAYANPRGGQPLGGRLEISQDRTGLTVVDPRSAATSPGLLKWAGAVLVVGGGIIGSVSLISFASDKASSTAPLACSVVAMNCGILCYFWSSKVKQNPRRVRVEAGQVHTQGCPGHTWIFWPLIPKKFTISRGSTDLRTLQSIHSIKVRYFTGISCLLIPGLSRDEAIWAVDLLNRALRDDSPDK